MPSSTQTKLAGSCRDQNTVSCIHVERYGARLELLCVAVVEAGFAGSSAGAKDDKVAWCVAAAVHHTGGSAVVHCPAANAIDIAGQGRRAEVNAVRAFLLALEGDGVDTGQTLRRRGWKQHDAAIDRRDEFIWNNGRAEARLAIAKALVVRGRCSGVVEEPHA